MCIFYGFHLYLSCLVSPFSRKFTGIARETTSFWWGPGWWPPSFSCILRSMWHDIYRCLQNVNYSYVLFYSRYKHSFLNDKSFNRFFRRRTKKIIWCFCTEKAWSCKRPYQWHVVSRGHLSQVNYCYQNDFYQKQPFLFCPVLLPFRKMETSWNWHIALWFIFWQ